MLANSRLIALIPTRDVNRARAFYETALGLRFVSDDAFALVFDANGTMVRIVRVGNFTPFPFTLVGWDVPDIEAAVAGLAAHGVQFLRFHGMEQDAAGIWAAPGSSKIAWFKDPDGNTLSLSQH